MDVRIVVVDDDRANVELLRRMLERAGYPDVVGADDPARGIELCVAEPTGLLLLDLHMGATDGYEVMEAVLAQVPDLPIIVVTGEAGGAVRQRAINAGAVSVLVKPFEYDDLVAQASEHIRRPE